MKMEQIQNKEFMKRTMNSKPTSQVINVRTGEIETFSRAYWLENRGGMLFSALCVLGILAAWTVIVQYMMVAGLFVYSSMSDTEQFWFFGGIVSAWINYIGGFLIEYGIRKRQIAMRSGQSVDFSVGGFSITIGTIMATIGTGLCGVAIVLFAIPYEPYVTWTDNTPGFIMAMVNVILPLISLIGGILLAKAIRGKDTVEEAFS